MAKPIQYSSVENVAPVHTRSWLPLLACLALAGVTVWVWAILLRPAAHELQVSFLDVGQGDSILIRSPTGVTILIDGGPDRSVLREMPKKLGFMERAIDLIIETHPDKDHIAGLADVLQKYDVSYFMDPGIPNDTNAAAELRDALGKEPGLTRFLARRGMRLHLGGGAYADVLFPDRDVSQGETNDGSVTLRVVYGSTSFLMAGDLPTPQEDYLAALDGTALRSDVLKASHHGSKHSSSSAWLAAVHPSIAVISAGKKNSYGHPAPEVLERIRAAGAGIRSTIDTGTITFTSDGTRIWQE